MRLALSLLFAAAALGAHAGEPQAAPKYLWPGYPTATTPACPAGQAIKYEVVCDPGSRPPVMEIFDARMPGVSICRAKWIGCGVITGYVPREKFDGMEVRDAETGNELVLMSFGLERLLGEGVGPKALCADAVDCKRDTWVQPK